MIDGEVRQGVVDDYRSSVALSAGAGTGKTTLLVSRIVEAWSSEQDTIDPSNTLAITFTRAAALEMRVRLRYAMQARAAELGSPIVSERAQMVDAATIGTIHAFCRDVLEEFCLEAGLPPRFSQVSKTEEKDLYQKWWNGFLEGAFADENSAFLLLHFLGSGKSLASLYQLAMAVEKSRLDLRGADNSDASDFSIEGYKEEVAELIGKITEICDGCSDDSDKLYVILRQYCSDLKAVLLPKESDDAEVRFRADGLNLPTLRMGTVGVTKAWGRSGKEVRDAVRSLVGKPISYILRALVALLFDALERFASERAQRGQVTMDDLLTLAHDLFTSSDTVRRAICQRFPNIYLDEVQDTDPIQSRIIIALSDFAAANPDLPNLSVFVVGDVEQSIYGFRGASPDTFQTLIDRLGLPKQNLTTNFRCHEHILEWVNPRFLQEGHHLHAGLELPHGEQTRVQVTGVPQYGLEKPPTAHQHRLAEAQAIASFFHEAKSQEWQIRTRGEPAPAKWSDMVVLCSTRASWPYLMNEFERLGIPFQTEVDADLFELPEFAELVEVLTAIGDPEDSVADVAASRSVFICNGQHTLLNAMFGISTNFSPWPYGRLASWRELVRGLSPTSALVLLEAKLEPLVVGIANPDKIRGWNRYRRVLLLAHAQVAQGARSLFEVALRLQKMRSQKERFTEVVGAQDDVDAVRLLTAHGAKGLEFPIVAISGFFFSQRSSGYPIVGVESGRVAVDVDKDFTTGEGLRDARREKERVERRRLLYVACTRARDYLLVSAHGLDEEDLEKRLSPEDPFYELKSLLAEENRYVTKRRLEPFEIPYLPEYDVPPYTKAELERQRWSDPAIFEPVKEVPPDHEAEAIAKELEEERRAQNPDPDPPQVTDDEATDRDSGEEGEVKGNFGAAIGRAVHATLLSCDLSEPSSARKLAGLYAEMEGVGTLRETVAAYAESALSSPLVQAAAQGDCYRELAIGFWDNETDAPKNRYIDLLYRTDKGYILVDYKTDRVDASSASYMARYYKAQIGEYADFLNRHHGIQVVEAYILFVSRDPAIAIQLI